ncbi:T9SS type A sorting domain-containing protein [Flavobacterium agricola]|uniref:T9SS type A sorting domain-containing protein n=1 Tax=Flavobacterium agricola TaxID=2870839 RepID=A0ABY6LZU0_9FLAO|nr:T9SS type A sorting domain-containing protein [Flavobacterium agricola]UYW01820.1 T9SS type A sorting domain-containing protein [Flavobacterium agricola]
MKKILFLFFFINNIIYAQNSPIGQYEIYLEGWLRGNTQHHCGNAEIDLILSKNGKEEDPIKIFKEAYQENSPIVYFGKENDKNIKGTKSTFSAEFNISGIIFFAERRINSSCRGDRPYNKGAIYSGLNTSCYTRKFNFDEFRNISSNRSGLWNSEFTLFIRPKLEIVENGLGNNFLITDVKTNIVSHTHFRPNEYNWEYSINGVDYIKLPQYDGLSAINVSAFDILGDKMLNLIGKSIFIRQYSSCQEDSVLSKPVEYTILPSAPKIISNSDKKGYTSCFDSNDGQIRVFFDRPLNNSINETINLSIINKNNSTANISIPNISSLNNDNSFLIEGLSTGEYKLQIIGKYGDNKNTYSETTVTPYEFQILRHDPVDFTISKVDVWCYGGADGEITVSATGGTKRGYEYRINDGDWIPFSNDSTSTQLIKNLSAGQYKIMVRDSNHCVARVQNIENNNVSLGNVKDPKVVINAPQSPLELTYTQTQKPTFYGATNGKIVTMVNGGTPFNDNTYWFEWKNEQGAVLPATGQYISSSFYISLENIPAGKYYLSIRDKNYDNATTNENCTIIEDFVEITQPEPLVATIELIRPISCHVANEYGDETDLNPYDGQRDESQDGVLKVNVTGGTPFTGSANSGKPYKYIWKKQNPTGTWQTLVNTDATISLLSDGNYAANVEDANGVVIGVYQNNSLVTPTDVTYYLQQPEQLQVDFQITPVTCKGNDGKIKAFVTGGTAPYTYSWTTGDTSEEITNAVPMNYFVTITDARGCMVQGKTTIVAPVDLTVLETITPLTCYDAINASIKLEVNGSIGPYTYLWNTGETTKDITNLKAGTYQVTITDGQGCNYVYNYTIANPEKLKIDLGPDRTLCLGQTLELDATIYNSENVSYEWRNSLGYVVSNSAKLIVNYANKYTVSAITPNGCVITDSIEVNYSDVEIDAEFLLTTQAYVNQDVILVNVSNPKGQTTDWQVNSPEIKIVNKNNDYITLNFSKVGTYNITLRQTQGDCYMIYNKEIIVEANSNSYNPDNTNASFVKEFIVAPNPNNGNFEVKVELEREAAIKLRLFTVTGQLAQAEKKSVTATKHLITYNTQLSAGTYILVLETTFQTLTKKIIIY